MENVWDVLWQRTATIKHVSVSRSLADPNFLFWNPFPIRSTLIKRKVSR